MKGPDRHLLLARPLPPALAHGPTFLPLDDLTTATLTQSGGTVIASSQVMINDGGTYLLSGGTLLTPSLINNGSFNVSGGTIDASITNNTTATMSGGTVSSGYTLTNSGTFNLSGGTLSVSTLSNSGSVAISGGNTGRSVIFQFRNDNDQWRYGHDNRHDYRQRWNAHCERFGAQQHWWTHRCERHQFWNGDIGGEQYFHGITAVG